MKLTAGFMPNWINSQLQIHQLMSLHIHVYIARSSIEPKRKDGNPPPSKDVYIYIYIYVYIFAGPNGVLDPGSEGPIYRSFFVLYKLQLIARGGWTNTGVGDLGQ